MTTNLQSELNAAIQLARNADFTGAMNKAESIVAVIDERDIVFAVRVRLELATFQILAGFPTKALTNLNWSLGQAHGPHKEEVLADSNIQYRLIDGYSRYIDACLDTGILHVSELTPLIDDAEEIARSFQRPSLELKIKMARSVISREQGLEEETIASMKQNIIFAIDHRLDDIWPIRTLAQTLTLFERAKDAIALLEPLTKKSLSVIDSVAVLTQLGHACLEIDDAEAAVDYAERAAAYETRVSANIGAAIWGLQVDAHRAVGNLAAAKIAADKVYRAANTLAHPGLQFNALTDLFDVNADEGALDDAEALLVQVESLAETLDGASSLGEHREKFEERRRRLDALRNAAKS